MNYSRSANYEMEAPPSYEDALVAGVIQRSGRTPFPEAPRMMTRGLSTESDEPDTVKLARELKEINRKAAQIAEKKVEYKHSSSTSSNSSRVSSTSGWQSDTSHTRSSKRVNSSSTKKKHIAFETISETPSSPAVDCRISPLMAYHPRKPLLRLDLSLPPGHIRLAGGDISKQLSHAQLNALATSTPVTLMSIHLSTPLDSWTVDVTSSRGVTIRHVLEAIRSSFYGKLTRSEWAQVKQPYRDRVKEAFMRRCRNSDLLEAAEAKNGLRRVDLLCDNVIWKGLSPHPQEEGAWVLTLGPL